MTLREVIIQQISSSINHCEVLPTDPLTEHVFSTLAEIEIFDYNAIMENGADSIYLIKLLHESAKAYGEAKFNEGVEAARIAIVDDHSVPPQFVP